MSRGPVDVRLLRHARTSRLGVAGLVVLGVAQAAATLAVAGALTALVVGFAGGRGDARAVAVLGGAYAARAALSWAEQVVARRTAARVGDELRRTVLAAALRHGPAWVAGYGSGRLSALLGGGIDSLRPWFAGYLPALVLGVVLPPCVVTVMAVVDPVSAVITLVTLPLLPAFGMLVGWATHARARQRWVADARLAGHFLDVVRGLPTLRLFGRAERQTAVVREMTERHRAATMRVLRLAFLSSTSLDLVGTLSVGLVAVGVGLRVAAGDLGLGPAMLVILLAPEAYRPVREMAARYHAATDATAVIADVDEVSRAPVEAYRRRDSGAAPGIAVLGLRVRHAGATTDALALACLTVRGGEIVALAGASGAGKTTALRVLAGTQPPYAGDVVVSGPRPLYLPQRPTLPHARTIREALTPDRAPPGAAHPGPATDLARAVRAVGLDAEIAGLPAGLDTALGEHGNGVSSGQRQRLGLARMLREAHHVPSVLLLDEPTAHLDPDAEALVIAQLRHAATRGCAVLVAAHRPALLAAADRVVTIAPALAPATGGPPGPPARPLNAPPARPLNDPPVQPRSDPPVRPRNDPPARPRSGRVDDPAGGSMAPGATPGAVAGWRRWGGTAVLVGAASALAGLVLTGAAGWLLVRAAALPPVLTLSTAVVLVRGSAVARPLLRYLERLVSHEVAFARLGSRRSRVYADLVPRVPGTLSRRGDLLTRVVDDVDATIDGLLRGRLPAAVTGVTLAVTAAAVLLFATVGGRDLLPGGPDLLPRGPDLLPGGWGLLPGGAAVPVGQVAAGLMGLGLLGAMLAVLVAPALAGRQARRWDAMTSRARAALRDAVVETVDGLEELAGRGERAALAVPRRRSRELSRLEARAARTAGAATALAHLGWAAVVVAAAVLSGAAVRAGLGPEVATVLLLGMVVAGESVPALPETAVARHRAAGARRRLAAIADRQPQGRPAAISDRQPRGRPETGVRWRRSTGGAALEVRGLVAGWDPRRPPALRGLDLVVPAGARVAIRGVSGCGKSTFAAVLVDLVDARAGTVRLDGVPLRATARGRVCLVGDDVDHVFGSTVRENLRLADPEADDDALRDVLARVRLDGWSAGLPQGLDTLLGEGAGTVSGGQRRRLAAARALLADPDLLVLDEPTEGLDAPTAAALMADLLAASAGRTVVLLTHRDEGVGQVDAVYELTGGRLAPTGKSGPADEVGFTMLGRVERHQELRPVLRGGEDPAQVLAEKAEADQLEAAE